MLTSTDRALLIAITVFLSARWLATLFGGGQTRTWGMDFASYLPLSWDIVAALSLPVILFIPLVRRLLGRLTTEGAGDEINTSWRLAAVVVVSVIWGVLAWHYQVAYAFLGDGAYYATEIIRIAGDTAYRTALVKPTSWLTGHVIHWLAVMFQPENIRWPFQIVGVIGMILVAGGSVLLTLRVKKDGAVLLVSAVLLTAASLMFFGYIELYALSYALTVLFFLSSYQCFRFNGSVIVAGLLLAAAIACGASAVIFIPAFLLLLHWRVRGEGGAIPLTRAALVLIVLSVIAVIGVYAALGLSSFNPYVLSIFPAELVERGISQGVQEYTLLSVAHLLDVVNVLLLNGGVLVVILPVLLLALRRRITWSDPVVLFAMTAGAAALLLILTGNTTFGLMRDWDVMTVPAIGLVAAACLMLLHAHDSRSVTLSFLLPLLVLTSFGSQYTWLKLNMDELASSARFDDALVRDMDVLLPLNTYIGLENLRKYHFSTKDREQLRVVLKRMAGTGVQKIDTYSKLQTMISQSKDQSERRRDFEWLFERYMAEYTAPPPANSVARIHPRTLRESVTKCLLIGLQTGDVDVVTTWLEKLRPLIPDWKEVLLVDAYFTPNFTLEQLAARAREVIDASTEDAALLVAGARWQKNAGQFAGAAEYYSLALKRDAYGFPAAYLELAQIYLEELDRRDEGVATLRRCLRETPNSPEASQARELLSRLGDVE